MKALIESQWSDRFLVNYADGSGQGAIFTLTENRLGPAHELVYLRRQHAWQPLAEQLRIEVSDLNPCRACRGRGLIDRDGVPNVCENCEGAGSKAARVLGHLL